MTVPFYIVINFTMMTQLDNILYIYTRILEKQGDKNVLQAQKKCSKVRNYF